MPEAPELPSLDRIYAEFAVPVSRLCGRMIRDREKARDAAQDAWLEILKSLPSFEGRSSLATWLWTIVRRSLSRFARREKTYSTRFLAEFCAIHAEDGMEELERVPVEDRRAWVRLQCEDCLTGMLHCLGNEDRFLHLLRVLGGLGYGEIGEVMGLEEAAVRQRASRAARKLSRFLNAECQLYNPEGSCRCKLKLPMREVDAAGEYRQVREMARKILFLNAAALYHGEKDYWRELYEEHRAS